MDGAELAMPVVNQIRFLLVRVVQRDAFDS